MTKKHILTLLLSGVLLLSGCNKANEPATGLDIPEDTVRVPEITEEAPEMRDRLPTAEEMLADAEERYTDYDFEIVDVYEESATNSFGGSITVYFRTTPSIHNLFSKRAYLDPSDDDETLYMDTMAGDDMKAMTEMLPSDILFTRNGYSAYTKELVTLQDVKRVYEAVDDFPILYSGISDEQYEALKAEAVECDGVYILKNEDTRDMPLSLGGNVVFKENCRIYYVFDKGSGDGIRDIFLADANGVYVAVKEKQSEDFEYTTKVIDGLEILMEYHPNVDGEPSYIRPWVAGYSLSWEDIPNN